MSPARFLRPIASAAAVARPSIKTPCPSPLIKSTIAHQRTFHSSPARMVVHSVKTAEEFQQAVSGNQKVLVDCFAEWCGPCKAVAPILEKTSNDPEFGDVHFVQFDVDNLPELSQDLGVRAMPTFMLFNNGDKVEEVVGANPPAILQALRKLQ